MPVDIARSGLVEQVGVGSGPRSWSGSAQENGSSRWAAATWSSVAAAATASRAPAVRRLSTTSPSQARTCAASNAMRNGDADDDSTAAPPCSTVKVVTPSASVAEAVRPSTSSRQLPVAAAAKRSTVSPSSSPS
ncbi:MAG: hypothetical protein R2755_33745 [Acidimicrobiales bacterium]